MFTSYAKGKVTGAVGRCRWVRIAYSVAFVLLLAPGAHAGFIDIYPFKSFTLVNSEADGAAEATLGALPFVITGGNNGGGGSGTTDLVTEALGPGRIVFGFSFESADEAPYESAGYLLRGMYFELTNTGGVVGVGEFSVAAGDIFGWRVFTLDNQGEPGILRVDDGAAPVPEPSMFLVVLAAMALIPAARRNWTGKSRAWRA